MPSLLPPSIAGDTRSRAFERLAARLESLGLPPILDPLRCPASALPILAQEAHIEGLEGLAIVETEAEARATIEAAYRAHQRRGTPAGMKAAMEAVGWPIQLEENLPGFTYNGQVLFDGSRTYTDEVVWGAYRVFLTVPEPKTLDSDVLTRIRAVLEHHAPARCYLDRIQAQLECSDTLPLIQEGAMAMSARLDEVADEVPMDLGGFVESLMENLEPVAVPHGYGESYGWAYGD